MNLRSPSTVLVNRASASIGSCLYPFASASRSVRPSFLSCASISYWSIALASSRAYQTSSSPIAANRGIASPYERTAASTASLRSVRAKLRSRPAISKLVARRLTSHSNGPGSVSSKSLRSNPSARSESERAPGREIGPRLEQGESVAIVGKGEHGMARSRRLPARRLATRTALGRADERRRRGFRGRAQRVRYARKLLTAVSAMRGRLRGRRKRSSGSPMHPKVASTMVSRCQRIAAPRS